LFSPNPNKDIFGQRITFAKEKSDIVAKKDGTFNPRQKRVREEKTPAESGRAPPPPTQQGATPAAAKAPKPIVNNIPHRILFAQNLPDECNDQMLATLFQQYPGFQEVRMAPGKKGIAFVEFQDVVQAGIAMQQLNGFQLSANDTLHLTYGKQ
jgi:U2 small nuclear ribonucleoprotein B''